jgi:heme-degrading monooxygenase HmoA
MSESLTRIVRMEFAPDKADDFLAVFEESRRQIRRFPGCEYLALCRDATDENVYYTHSRWRSAEDLEAYRQSELFRQTWARTKVLFGGKPKAYSLVDVRVTD